MTEPTPAQTEAERAAMARERLGGDLQFGGTVQPGWYAQPTGPGRWFLLYAHGEPLGYVWTNDRDGLGFRATTDAGRSRTPEFVLAFRAAYQAGVEASAVFDHWANLAGLGLQAGQVTNGTLETMPG